MGGVALCANQPGGLLILEGLTANVHDWWTPGQSLVSAVDALSAELTEIPMPMPAPSAHPVADAAAIEVVEAADPEVAGVPPKRYKSRDPDVMGVVLDHTRCHGGEV